MLDTFQVSYFASKNAPLDRKDFFIYPTLNTSADLDKRDCINVVNLKFVFSSHNKAEQNIHPLVIERIVLLNNFNEKRPAKCL
ncbi:MAG: hypothetical protein HY072_03380 [Deltaproteobacteria bacterium]|nr:hypothetical protein [Deltaproteobacteria bacterium]